MYRIHPVVRRALEAGHVDLPANAIGVHGALYDASSFANKHPGGAAIIKAVGGQDCTSLFETHHVDPKRARAMLRTLPRLGSYDQHPAATSCFGRYDELRAHALPLLRRRVSTVVHARRALWVTMLAVSHGALCLRAAGTVEWAGWVLVASVASTVCGGIGHDALHRVQPMAALLDWNGLSCFEWLLEHVSSHHMYTNSALDHDVISMRPFVEWTPAAVGLVGEAGMHAIFLVSELAVALQGFVGHRVRWVPLWDPGFPLWMRLAPLLFVVRLCTLVAGVGPLWGAATFLATVALAGYGFALLAHLNHAPAAYRTPSDDFVSKQLATTRDIRSFMPESMMLGLDRQTLHHLFPTVDHSLLDHRLRRHLCLALSSPERLLLRPQPVGALYQGMCEAARSQG
jgi:hypothetical protein